MGPSGQAAAMQVVEHVLRCKSSVHSWEATDAETLCHSADYYPDVLANHSSWSSFS